MYLYFVCDENFAYQWKKNLNITKISVSYTIPLFGSFYQGWTQTLRTALAHVCSHLILRKWFFTIDCSGRKQGKKIYSCWKNENLKLKFDMKRQIASIRTTATQKQVKTLYRVEVNIQQDQFSTRWGHLRYTKTIAKLWKNHPAWIYFSRLSV